MTLNLCLAADNANSGEKNDQHHKLQDDDFDLEIFGGSSSIRTLFFFFRNLSQKIGISAFFGILNEPPAAIARRFCPSGQHG